MPFTRIFSTKILNHGCYRYPFPRHSRKPGKMILLLFLINLITSYLAMASDRSALYETHVGWLVHSPDDCKRGTDCVLKHQGAHGILDASFLRLNESLRSSSIYSLEVTKRYTECSIAEAVKQLFQLMESLSSSKTIVLSDECHYVTSALATTTPHWGSLQISYSDSHPALSNRKLYPLFLRLLPPDTAHFRLRLQVLRHFGWSRVAIIYQDSSVEYSRYSMTAEHLSSSLNENEIEVIYEATYYQAAAPSIFENLKNKDARIILVNLNERSTMEFLCEAFLQDFNDVKRVFLLQGDFSADWWISRFKTSGCAHYDPRDILDGLFISEFDHKQPVPGKDAYSSYASDAVLTVKEALRITQDWVLKNNYCSITETWCTIVKIWLRNKVYDRCDKSEWTSLMLEAMKHVNFTGHTGRVQFRNQDRLGSMILRQLQRKGADVSSTQVASYDEAEDLFWMDQDAITFGEYEEPPLDRVIERKQQEGVALEVYLFFVSLSIAGIIVSFVFLAINFHFRAHNFIKLSSPTMNNAIALGCILGFGSVCTLKPIAEVSEPYQDVMHCKARVWALSLGFTLAFGALFSKTWRVYAIFTNPVPNKQIRDSKLLAIISGLLLLDVLMLILWFTLDPLVLDSTSLPSEMDATGNIKITPVLHFCSSKHRTLWIIAMYAYKGIFLVFGCFLAWETRKVKIAALNDSWYIGLSVYNTVITCSIGVATNALITELPNTSFSILSAAVLMGTFATLCLVFVPKLRQLRKDPKGETGRVRNVLKRQKSSIAAEKSSLEEISNKIDSLRKQREENEEILKQKRKLLQCLRERSKSEHVPTASMDNFCTFDDESDTDSAEIQ